MLEVKKHLNVTSEEFFELLRKSVLDDAKNNGAEGVTIDSIVNGFTYFKELATAGKNRTKVKTVVAEYVPNLKYVAQVFTSESEHQISYEVFEDESGVEVTYNEGGIFEKKMKKWNYSIVTAMTNKRNRKRIEDMLSAMERYVIDRR